MEPPHSVMELHRNIDNRVTCSGGSLLQPKIFWEENEVINYWYLTIFGAGF